MSARVSVIIPAYNEEEVIEACVESLFQQNFQDYEIHIIDDESRDQTPQILQSLQSKEPNRLKVHSFGKVGPGRARNLVGLSSESEILAFMDADCEAHPDWLQELIQAMDETQAASVGGPHRAPPDKSNSFQVRVEKFFSRLSFVTQFFQKSMDRRKTKHNPLCNVAYRAEIFRQLKGFREDLFPGEDYDFDWRLRKLGGVILYEPRALVYHHRPENLEAFSKVLFAYGRAQGKLFRERGPHRLQHFIAIAFFALPFAALLLWSSSQILAWSILVLFGLALFFRPPESWGLLALFFHGFNWFKGFIKGLITGQSPPPGSPPKPTKELLS